jgi:nitronate monooxygenase
MKIPKLDIRGLIATVPIIQGGMGIGVSGSRLASGVANEGGIGVISGVNIGYLEHDYRENPLAANLRALRSEIRKARELSPKGIIGLNLMVAINHYNEMVKAAVEEGIDLIISGAGLPMKLPELVKGTKTRIAPIVSSAKAAKLLLKFWDSHYDKTADLIIVEGPEAGGHLGFSQTELEGEKRSVLDIVREVIDAVNPFQEKFKHAIPVVAAGGIFTGEDISDCLKAGASGVQMGTRFVATEECDAHLSYKQQYVNAEQDDIILIKSPVGMPGRALNNPFIKKVTEYGDEMKECVRCIKGCSPKTAPYCISTALKNAVLGNVDQGLIFVGSNVHRIKEIVPVKELIAELVQGAEYALDRP